MTRDVEETIRNQPLIAVDVVPVRWSRVRLLIGSARRRFEPFTGRFALPGVLLGTGESLIHAATRSLQTKAGIGPDSVGALFQIGAFDGPDRDPRRHAISIAFCAVIDAGESADNADLRWTPAGDLTGLPFDHDLLVSEALRQLRTRLWLDDAVTRALTGPRFATSDAARLTGAVTNEAVHQSNLRRSLAAHPGLTSMAGGPGRRPLVWEWTSPEPTRPGAAATPAGQTDVENRRAAPS